ncbi:MAG: Eco57I restriction-modification methylase domain-containing protein [Candidatus Thorarchaeota archaeon]
MKHELNEIAWYIITGIHKNVVSASSSNTLDITEAVRLASLSYVIECVNQEKWRFSQLSYEAERLGVSYHAISNIIDSGLDSFKGPKLTDLTRHELVILLGLIHSIGSFHLPLHYSQGTAQRPLGAYYTPQRVADYIVSLTLTPTLTKLAESVPKKGVKAIDTILSLRTLDPACGTGVFLVSALNAYVNALDKGLHLARESRISHDLLESEEVTNFIPKLRTNLYGVDVDAGALEVTDVSLRLLSGSMDESFYGTNLKQGNSLVSLKGFDGNQSHSHYFSDAASRLPFEWSEEFEDVLRRGGFDFVVMNPPYERLKPNLAEFLRERIITGDREIHLEEFNTYKQQMNEDLQYFRRSGEYCLGNKYSIDTHRLFIERAIQLSRVGGNIGFIVPSTILGDLSSSPLRRSIIKENELKTVSDFPETSRLFEGVTQSVSIISLQKGGKTTSFRAQFGLVDFDNISNRSSMQIKIEKIEDAVGPHLSIPQLNEGCWSLFEKLHKHPALSTVEGYDVKRGELDLTLNKSCITSKETEFQLIRGSDISRYSLITRSKRPIEYVDVEKLSETLGSSSRISHINKSRIACQQVSNRTQRWRLKFTSIPKGFVLANSCNYITIEDGIPKRNLVLLQTVLNSELMNWRFGLTNTNNHVSIQELFQLPIPRVENISKYVFNSVRTAVNSVQNGNIAKESLLEAIVFSIYGFSPTEARTILELRKTPQFEIQEIVDTLQTM